MERFAIKIDEDGPLNLRKMCRLCGTINTGKIPILQNNVFFMEDGDPELWKKIFACVGIQVSKDDKMPQNVCALCHDKILDFYEFREMCISIDLQTRKMLGLPSIEVKKIEDHLVKIYKKQKTAQKRKTTEQKCLSTSSIKQSKLMKIENNSIFGNNNLEMKKNVKNHTLVNMIKDEDISSSSTANLKKRKASSTLQVNKNKKQMVDIKSEKVIYYDKRKSRKCNICAQLIGIPKFDEHLRTIHVPRIVPYHCVRCDESITKKPEIKNHNLWHKLSRTPYTCGRCNKNVETLVGYTRHINDCLTLDKGNNFKKQTIKCPNCNKSFIKSSNATRHIIRCKIKYENITETVIKQENSIDKAFTENNACVLIPSSVTNIRTSTSSSSLPPTNIESLNDKCKKSKKLTKKDMQRFDDLLKNTYETLQSIKQEPKDNHDTDAATIKNISNVVTEMEAKASNSNTEEIEKNSYDAGEENDNVDDGINRDNNDDYYSSDNNDNDDVGNGLPIPVNIKQEDLEIHDTEFEKDINESTTNNTTLPTTSDAEINTADADKQQPQPTIKLKIKKEHGTLNSLIVGDSNNCEDINSKKKKRKKKKSGDKDSSENETMENIKQEPLDDDDEDEQQINQYQQNCTETNIENNLPNDDDHSLSNSNNNSVTVPAVASSFVGESGVIKLPIISSVHSGIRIKQEIPDDFENLRVVIKQEKPDKSYENPSGMMEVNDADRNNSVLSVPNPYSNNLRLEDNNLTVTEQTQEPSPATVSSNNTINNTESNTTNQARTLFNMGTVQIKREINEDYANPIGEYDNNYEYLRRMVSSVVVKQEVQTNYDNVNNEINNGSKSNMTTANLTLNQYDPNIAANIKKEKNDETNSNSDLCRPATDTNVLQFKKIVLRTSSISNELDNENCSDKLEQENNTTNVEDSTVNNQSEKQDNENQENTETETEITKQSCSENDNGNDAGDELVTKSNDCGSSSEERITKTAGDDDAGGELVTKSNDCGSSSEEQITKEADDDDDDDDDVGDKPDEDLMLNKENCIREEIISNSNDLEMTENDSKQQNESESEIMNDHQSSAELKIDSENDKLSECDKISDDNLVEMKDSVEKITEIPKNEIPEITIASVLCGKQVDELLKTDEDDDVIEIKDEELLKTNEEVIEIEDDDDDEELENEEQEIIEQENEEQEVIEQENEEQEVIEQENEEQKIIEQENEEQEVIEQENEEQEVLEQENEEQEVIEQENVEEENEKAEQKEEKIEQEELKEIEDSNKKLNVEEQQCDNDDISPILDCPENAPLASTSHDFELNNSNLTKNIESDTDVNIKIPIPIESIVVKKERFNYEEIIEIESDDDDDIENNSQQIETICSVIEDDVVANNLNENELKLIDDNNSVDTNNETALKDTVIASDIETSPLESDETDKNETLVVEQTTIVAAKTIATSTTIANITDAGAAAMAATSTTNSSNLSIIPITTDHLENDNLETHSVVTTTSSSISLPIIDDNINEIAENNSENIEKELMNNDVDNDDELEEYDDSFK